MESYKFTRDDKHHSAPNKKKVVSGECFQKVSVLGKQSTSSSANGSIEGVLEKPMRHLHQAVRKTKGRDSSPSIGIIDSRILKISHKMIVQNMA